MFCTYFSSKCVSKGHQLAFGNLRQYVLNELFFEKYFINQFINNFINQFTNLLKLMNRIFGNKVFGWKNSKYHKNQRCDKRIQIKKTCQHMHQMFETMTPDGNGSSKTKVFACQGSKH